MTVLHTHISSRHDLLDLKLKALWDYRELVLLFTKRTFTLAYKQTILGPLWLLVNPLLSSCFQLILFGTIAKLSTDGIPQFLFYFTGNTIWNFFSTCVSTNATTFTANSNLFSKVYFPRMTVPLAAMLNAAARMGLLMLFLCLALAYYGAAGLVSPHWGAWLFLPLIVLQLGLTGMGTGIIISSLTTKYRDLSVLVSFGLQLWMYATPVVYPLSAVPAKLQPFLRFNPLTPAIELFRYAVLGTGTLDWPHHGLSLLFMAFVTLAGIIIFNKVERNFLDVI